MVLPGVRTGFGFGRKPSDLPGPQAAGDMYCWVVRGWTSALFSKRGGGGDGLSLDPTPLKPKKILLWGQ